MVFKKIAKKRFGKGRKVGRRNMRKRTTLVNRSLQPFAQRYISKMKYSDTFTLTLAGNGNYIYNLNSIFDPNRTGIGHQPYGHDTLATLYNRYRVINCSYNISFYSGGSVVRVVAIPVNQLYATVPSISELCEQPRSKWAIQIPGGNTKMIKGKISIPSLMGRTKAQYMADDRFQAEYGQSPSEAALLYIAGADVGDLSATIQCTITLNYLVESFDPKLLGQS